MNTFKKTFAVAVASSVLFASCLSAEAGGLFGDGGLIRGSVGEFLDRNLEKPITTPLARAGTVAAGTALGTFAGGEMGQPAIGGLIGNQLGHCVNDIFAGGDCGARNQPQAPQPQPSSWQPQRGGQPGPAMIYGNFCFTAFGRAGPGPAQPTGTFCRDVYGNPGHIVR